MFLVVFPKESPIRNGWHQHHGACECCQVNVQVKNPSLSTWAPFWSKQEKGWAGVGWSRLVAIFGRDPGEVQARSEITKIPSPDFQHITCFVFHPSCSLHIFSLCSNLGQQSWPRMPTRSGLHHQSLPNCPRTTGYRSVMQNFHYYKDRGNLKHQQHKGIATTICIYLHGTHEKLTISHQLEKTSTW